jgi:hypothetical protein
VLVQHFDKEVKSETKMKIVDQKALLALKAVVRKRP